MNRNNLTSTPYSWPARANWNRSGTTHLPHTRMSTGLPPRVAAAPQATCPPERVWKALAQRVAADGRTRMRLWSRDTDKFSDTAKLSDTPPRRPAAVYIYNKRGRTQLLALDFDAKHHGAAAVEADIANATAWITQCGGVAVTDRSTSGGRHLLCPLAIGTTASVDEITHLMRLLAARLPTLDITPATNPATGCITPPGSPCREGGHRQLDGPLEAAIDAFTTRAQPDLLPRLYMLLGALKPSTDQPHHLPTTSPTTFTVGHGDQLRLAPDYVRQDPLPAEVSDYATHGWLSSSRPTWLSNHEARMSVITQAIARGANLQTLRDKIAPDGPWHHGLGRAYRRYRHHADNALTRDFTKALDWHVNNLLKSSPPRHKQKYSQGGRGESGPCGPASLRAWLANATRWADIEFAGKRYRWTVHAVLQAIAFHAVTGGEQRAGTWVVGVGGRSLSLAAGLLSEDTVWRVLADLRDRAGAPIVLVRQHIGLDADVYALTTQNRVNHDGGESERIRIEPVHDAWHVLGHHLRRVYELITHHGLTNKADIYAAARVARSTGDSAVLDLQTAGLITRTGWGTVAPGPITLDTIAERHQLDGWRAERIERYRAERNEWRSWLAEREDQRRTSRHPHHDDTAITTDSDFDPDHAAWLESVMATGPPLDEEQADIYAIDLLAALLGARIVAT